MKVVNYATYVQDGGRVDAARAEHQNYADALREHDRLAIGGPLIGENGQSRGVLLVYEVASKQQAETLVKSDPFVLHDAIADYRLDEWTVLDCNVELLTASLVAAEKRVAPKESHAACAAAVDPDICPARTYVNYTRYVAGRSRVARVTQAHRSYARALLAISREAQDRWAVRSQQRFAGAQERGVFDADLVAVEVKAQKGTVSFSRDEAPRPETTIETLAKLRPAFRSDGSITAGNAPGLNSGAAAMLVAERGFAEVRGIEPFARLVAFGVAAVEPGMFGLGPVPAVHMALERAGWKHADVDRVEINEAFAAVPLAVIQKLGLAEDIVNVEGGAIAHGHPIGATGAVLTTRLIHSMRRDGLRRGIVTLCIGGGQGLALALEIV
ncbi:acetyl-CoA C-acyltransferase [Paraburkholderia sp. DGU8]|uniref:acetyl-CoA C-acyltransferase n=1 Tax=Paraburkholderia sp. DGU8 TaxID=3161997 RepID=UPI0034667273